MPKSGVLHSRMRVIAILLLMILLAWGCSNSVAPATAPETTPPDSESPEPTKTSNPSKTQKPESPPAPTETPINMNWVIHEISGSSTQLSNLMYEYRMATEEDNTGYLRHVVVIISNTELYYDVPIDPLIYVSYYLDRALSLAEKNKLPGEIEPRNIETEEIQTEVEGGSSRP